MAFYEKLLKEDEQLVRVIRSFPIAFFWPFFWGLVLFVVPFFFIIPLIRWEVIGSILFAVPVFIGFIILLRTVIIAYFNSLIVTNRRVIDWDQRGLFDKVISEADYDKIQDISYRVKGPIGTMLNYGTIQIQTAGSAPVLELRYVRLPRKTQALITDVKHNYKFLDTTFSPE